jgi:hypothetical protein
MERKHMSTAVCPRCGLADFEPSTTAMIDTGTWTEKFVRLCEHVHERRHLKDLRTHSCPHWAKAMQDAAGAQDRRTPA